MPSSRPTKTLTVFLGREGFTKPSEFLNDEARTEATAYPLRRGQDFTGTVFVPPIKRGTPDWVHFLNEGLAEELPRLVSSGVSAVLVIKYSDRLFAFTFGHAGRSMLQPGAHELDFGLKVVLNRVDVNQLRSVDTKTFEDIVINTRKQTSRSSQLGAFALDISRDILRGVVGDPTDKTYFKRIAGADAAVFTTELDFEDLGDICEELLDAYHATEYRKNFEWVDRVKQVRDDALSATLDGLLLNALQTGQTGSMHLAPAEIVDWEKIEEFSFGGSGKRQVCTYPELTLHGYLDTLGAEKLAELNIEALRHHPVRVKYTHAPGPVTEFTVYECLVWDTPHDGRQFALMDGRWFEIETAFATRVLQQADSLHQPGAYLIAAQGGQREEDYNAAVVAALPGYALLDQKNIRTDDMASPVEACDLFSGQREFIHIKKRSSSATLSHLFSQGSVAAELFIQDANFRSKIREQLTADQCAAHAALIPMPQPDASQFSVVYAIITQHDAQGRPPRLPFFSAVNLVQHHQRLRRLGLQVVLRYIPLN